MDYAPFAPVFLVIAMALLGLYCAHMSRFTPARIEGFYSGGSGADGGGVPGIEVYLMDGCPHCESVKPTIDKLEKSGEVEVERIMSDDKRCQENKVRAFPTICRVDGSGSRLTHKGGRDYDSIMRFAKGLTAA
jgi:glutaredoxin